jgi:histidine triad (HIT) family protein
MNMEDCVFCKIRDKNISKEFTYEDDSVMVLPDINPIKPIHLLIIPKEHVEDFLDLDDLDLLEKLQKTTKDMVKKLDLQDKGYRITVNGGGAQVVNHLHIHLVGPVGKGAKM